MPSGTHSATNGALAALLDERKKNRFTHSAVQCLVPPDGYDDGDEQWPAGVNLVMIADGLFTQCENGEVGCAASNAANYGGCLGTALLEGTGFDAPDDGCQPSHTVVGGGTGWLTMSGNVTPGETIDLRLAIWDSSGHIFDSLVLLDEWRWSLDAAEPGVAPG